MAEIELPRLGLRFKANGRGDLECLGFNGLCAEPRQPLKRGVLMILGA